MSNYNIIYIGAFRFPNGDAAAQRVLNNAKIFKELGYTVEFISWGGGTREEDQFDDGFYYYQGFKYTITHEIDVKFKNPFKRFFRFLFGGKRTLKILNEKLNEINIIIIYNSAPFFTLKLLSLCKKNNIKLISDTDEWFDPNEFPGGKFALPAWINELNMCIVQKKVKNKVLISNFLANFYSKSNRITIPPLIDSNDPKWINFENKLEPFNGIRLIYAGNPGKNKDLLDTIINAVIESLNEGLILQFVVLGVYQNDIQHYSCFKKILNFPQNIIFLGKIPQTDVPSYYNQCDFSILIREKTRKNMAGFPTKVVESMMSGCPVIFNDTSDILLYTKDGFNCILVKDSTLDELKKSLHRVCSFSKSDLNFMKVNSKKTALDKFDFKNYVSEISNFVARLR